MEERIYHHQFMFNQELQIDLTLGNQSLQFVSVTDYSKVKTRTSTRIHDEKLHLSKTEIEMTILIQIKDTYTQNDKNHQTALRRRHSRGLTTLHSSI